MLTKNSILNSLELFRWTSVASSRCKDCIADLKTKLLKTPFVQTKDGREVESLTRISTHLIGPVCEYANAFTHTQNIHPHNRLSFLRPVAPFAHFFQQKSYDLGFQKSSLFLTPPSKDCKIWQLQTLIFKGLSCHSYTRGFLPPPFFLHTFLLCIFFKKKPHRKEKKYSSTTPQNSSSCCMHMIKMYFLSPAILYLCTQFIM